MPRAVPLVRDAREPPGEPQLPALERLCEEAVLALGAAGFAKVDYVAVRAADTLKTVGAPTEGPLRVLAAAWLGGTRLIDNLAA